MSKTETPEGMGRQMVHLDVQGHIRQDENYRIYYDGSEVRIRQVVLEKDLDTGKTTRREKTVERQPLVKEMQVKNQDIEATRLLWRDKFKKRVIKVEDADGRCVTCGGKIEIAEHQFDDDDAQTRRTYRLTRCVLCGRTARINNSERDTPYDELGEKEE